MKRINKLISFFTSLNLTNYNNLHTGRWHLAIVNPPSHFNCRCIYDTTALTSENTHLY